MNFNIASSGLAFFSTKIYPEGIKLKDATVHKGEGVEHAFIRQIENNPELAQVLGFEGDINEKEVLHKFAGKEAHKLAIKMGYVGGDGKQIHITEADKVAFELKINMGTANTNTHLVVIEKTIDGKIIGTYDNEKGYEFGKNPENQYEKAVNTTHQKMVHQDVEKNETPVPAPKPATEEMLEKQAKEHIEEETKKMEAETALKAKIEEKRLKKCKNRNYYRWYLQKNGKKFQEE